MKIIKLLLLLLCLTSCSNNNEPTEVGEAHVTFTYTVPEELFKYAEITVCYNNNEGTDAMWQPMLDNTITVTYDLEKFPVVAPVVFVYSFTNRPANVSVDWNIIMSIEAEVTINGYREKQTYDNIYTIDGNLKEGLDALIQNTLSRTFAVKISRDGNIQFINNNPL